LAAYLLCPFARITRTYKTIANQEYLDLKLSPAARLRVGLRFVLFIWSAMRVVGKHTGDCDQITIEAELTVLTVAVREGIALTRFFKPLRLTTGDVMIQLYTHREDTAMAPKRRADEDQPKALGKTARAVEPDPVELDDMNGTNRQLTSSARNYDT
jgi:hypothetical protein